MTRRELLVLASAALVAKPFTKPIGLQIYTLRNVMQNPDEVLGQVAQIGFKEVEVLSASMDTVCPLAKKHGLTTPSCHLDMKLVNGLPGSSGDLERTLDTGRKYGIRFFGMPYVAPGDRTPEKITALIGNMNQAAELVKKKGGQFFYHHHAFEFGGEKGQRVWDQFQAKLDRNVMYEIDVMWASVAGQDPVAILNSLKGRVACVHLKDKGKGTPVAYTERVDKSAFAEVGSGELDWPKVLAAAEAAGVKHYFVEQDQTPGNPLDSIKQSYQFLKGLK